MHQNSNLEKKEIKHKLVIDVLKMANKYKPKKKISALKLREKFEKEYERG